MTLVATRYGKMRILESDQIVSGSLALYGEWAEDEMSLLAGFISPGSCVLDVGAFIGTHTLAFARLVGPHGKVYAFEPRREVYAVLSENIATNDCRNVSALNIGLGSRHARLMLPRIDLASQGNFGGLQLAGNAEVRDGYEIEVSTLDALDIGRIDLIKLDVEGMERQVLDGAVQSIRRHQPILFCECNSINAGADLLEFCKDNGYAAYAFLASAFNPDNFNRIEEDIFEDSRELGLLLIPVSKLEVDAQTGVSSRLCRVETLEDLVLPLLHKPQYAHEVLATTAAGSALGIHFPSPAVDEYVAQVAVLQKEIARVKSTVSWRITKPLRALWNLWRSLLSRTAK